MSYQNFQPKTQEIGDKNDLGSSKQIKEHSQNTVYHISKFIEI